MGVNYDKCRFTKRKILRPSLKLFGAKTRVRDRLYYLMPEDPPARYYEPFLGTGGVLLGMQNCQGRTGYDVNQDLINYYHVLQQRPEEFWDVLNLHLDILFKNGPDDSERGRELFNSWKGWMNDKYTDEEAPEWSGSYKHRKVPVDWAVKFYLLTKLGFNGIWRRNNKGKLNTPYCKTIRGRGIFTREWYDKVREEIKDVEYMLCDFRWAFKDMRDHYLWSGDFIFCDPPYRETTNKQNKRQDYNGSEFTDKDHEALRDLLLDVPAKFMLTINDDDVTRKLYVHDTGFHALYHDVNYCCSQTPAGRGDRPEIIVTNYEIPKEKVDKVQQVLADAAKLKRSKVSGDSRPLPSSRKKGAKN